MLRYILFHHQTTTHSDRYYNWSGCVISSFITKPQLAHCHLWHRVVALYPLSSPNHNCTASDYLSVWLRYILFHHQTTTIWVLSAKLWCCVISSFITKPQLAQCEELYSRVALYPLSSPNHNNLVNMLRPENVALYPLSSPNHNRPNILRKIRIVALYPLSSPNHNLYFLCVVIWYSYTMNIVQEMEWWVPYLWQNY